MQKSRRFAVLAGLALLAFVASPAKAGKAQATPSHNDFWLAFDGASRRAEPDLILIGATAQAVELQATLPGCDVETADVEGQAYSRLWGEGYGHPATVGLPDVPVLRRDVEIPFGAQVSLELVNADFADYALADRGLMPIYPTQPPLPKLGDAKGKAPFQIDRDFYAGGALYPSTPLALGEVYVVRGHRVQPVEVWPVAYDPAAGTVRLYSRLTFRLRLIGSDMSRTQAQAGRYASPAFEPRLAQHLVNYNQGRPTVEFGSKPQIGYLIVTADAYYDAMLPLVNLRESRGFDVTMVRCTDIGGCGSASAIKTYIQNAYDTWPLPPSYLLLVGDTNTIPTWTGPTIGTSTDLYYGTMDGSSDWHPDLGRGRFPVRSAEQTTAMVDKYLAYANLTGQEPWLKWASFAATCDNYPVAEGTHNYVINNHTAPGGYTGTFPTDPQPGGDELYCISHGATHADLVNAFDEGRWAIIYSGHGSYSGWEMGFTPSDVQNLTNYGVFPFVASHACLSGDFGQPEVFGETWVLQANKGALVYWGSSTYSYWDEDDVLERAMFDSLFAAGTPHATVAGMTDDGLAAVDAAYPGSARYYRETYNVLGDPAVKILWEADLPTFTLGIEPGSHEICTSGSVTSSVEIASILGYSNTVNLATSPLPTGITATVDPASAQAPFTSTLTMDVAMGTPAGDYGLILTATDQVSWTLGSRVDLRVVNGAPQAPALVSPPDGATGQPLAPTFEWSEAPWAASYRFQLDRDPRFGAPLLDENDLSAASYTPDSPLAGGGCYWWHVQGDNACGSGAWSEPFHFATVQLATAFYDNIESGNGNWSHQAQAAQGIDHWQISTSQSHSPTHAWFVPDDPVVTDSRLWNTTPIAVGSGSTLTFWHRYQFEGTSYDGAVLEISANGGPWTDLGPHIAAPNGYNGTISTSYGNPLAGRQAWTGDLTDWTQVKVDLSSFAGQTVRVRWRLGCDSSLNDVGWYIDDVQITSPLPPNPAPALLSITPASGPTWVDTPVQIEGSNFVGTPNVELGDTWLLSVTQVSSTTLQAVVPAGIAGGIYDLTLYNGDCQEASLPAAYTVVAECVSPTAALAGNSRVGLRQPLHLEAQLSAGTPPLTYTWDFGGPGYGKNLDTATPVFTYTATGEYAVELTVANPCGSAVVTQEVSVKCISPTVTLASDSPVELGQAMHFAADLLTGTLPVTYTWGFGGPGESSGGDTATPIFTYRHFGTFGVLVTATNECGTDTDSATVEVLCDAPQAEISTSSPVSIGEPMAFAATVGGTPPLTLTWDFGDGLGISNQASPTYTYTACGDYVVTLTVEGPCGSAVITAPVSVEPIWRYVYLPLVVKDVAP
jgi:PKD repeat protein